MATIINADTSDGLKLTSDTSGEIQFQSGGTTKMTVSSSGVSGIPTYAGTKNLIINGDMRIAQRGTSFTDDNVYTLDRWKSGDGTGGTPARTLSQQTFTLGQTDVPNAYYYLQHNQTGASTNGNSSLVQKIEDVTQFDGQTITISFYAKADASMNIDIRLIQNFGTGGSPSANVDVSEIVSIGTSWTKYTVTKTLGSLSGKTLGTDGVNTSCLIVNIDFKPTTTFVFDVTLFQLETGTTATDFENLQYGQQLALCQRYCQYNLQASGYSTNTTTVEVPVGVMTEMRAVPTGTVINTATRVGDYGVADRNITALNSVFKGTINGVSVNLAVTTTTASKPQALQGNTILFSAEL